MKDGQTADETQRRPQQIEQILETVETTHISSNGYINSLATPGPQVMRVLSARTEGTNRLSTPIEFARAANNSWINVALRPEYWIRGRLS
ncbi:unnamed protein product [Leptosia nina]|uniref:Uncharacterized protein n=1 Tax=Leptosia nina TaxID=320188 RepID=A0AAV1IW15_9NEOP